MLGVVFAAGLGTRLRPLTERLPKPAVPLLDRALASYSIERLAALGVRAVAVNTHHLGEAVAREVGREVHGVGVSFVHEPVLLGTGGGLKNALETLVREHGASEPVVVMNGDIVFWPDLEAALAQHRELDAVATMVLRSDARAQKLGAIEMDASGRVRRLLGAPARVEMPLGEHMFTGVHVLSLRALDELPAQGCIIRSSYRRWIDTGAVVGGIADASPWRDLGTPAEYLRASLDLVHGDLRWPSITPSEKGVWLGEGASIDGAFVRDAVIGRGARVDAGVRLERVVVWPDTHVREDATDAILAPHASVRLGDALGVDRR